MDTQITARHFDAPSNLRSYATERITRLERFYDGITGVHVILSDENNTPEHKQAEITLHVYRQSLTAVDEATTFEEAIDGCVRRLRRQILKYKAKLRGT